MLVSDWVTGAILVSDWSVRHQSRSNMGIHHCFSAEGWSNLGIASVHSGDSLMWHLTMVTTPTKYKYITVTQRINLHPLSKDYFASSFFSPVLEHCFILVQGPDCFIVHFYFILTFISSKLYCNKWWCFHIKDSFLLQFYQQIYIYYFHILSHFHSYCC